MIGYDGHKNKKGSKIHAIVTKDGLPLNTAVSAGNNHDSRIFKEIFSNIKIKISRGRPHTRPKELLADSAYDTMEIRCYLRKRGIKSNIPKNRRNIKRRGPGRPTSFNDKSYMYRGAVERFFAWLKSFKRIAIRHERLVNNYHAFINLANILILWRVLK